MCLSIDVLGTSPARHAPFQARGSRQLMAKRMAIGTRPEQWPGDASPIVRGITTLDNKCKKNLCNNLD